MDFDEQLDKALHALDVARVRALVAQGLDVCAVDSSGYTSIMKVVSLSKRVSSAKLLAMVAWLVEQRVDLDTRTKYAESALSLASRIGHFDVVKLLLNAGANRSVLEFAPIHEAVLWGSVEDLGNLLEAGENIEARDAWFRTPWLLAIQSGSIAKAVWLSEHGASTQAMGRCERPPLFYAIETFDNVMLDWLITSGFGVEHRDKFGMTPLMDAVEYDNLYAIKRLLDAGADMEAECNGGTALSRAVSRDAAKLLTEHGARESQLTIEGARLLLGMSEDPDPQALICTSEDFNKHRKRIFPTENGQEITNRYYVSMIRSGISAYKANQLLGKKWANFFAAHNKDYEPVWCARRFGQSLTFLPDGRIVQIGGEHEDWYDSDFCIYNDVFVHGPNNELRVYGYPREIFPPTDFHSATLIDKNIYVIGCLGYPDDRRVGYTPVYRLDILSMKMSKMATQGDAPSWISRHDSKQISVNHILVTGGEERFAESEYRDNQHEYILNIETGNWRRRECGACGR